VLFPEQSKLPATAYSKHTQYYQILNTSAVRDGTDTYATGTSLALFNYSLAKSSPSTLEACGLTEHNCLYMEVLCIY